MVGCCPTAPELANSRQIEAPCIQVSRTIRRCHVARFPGSKACPSLRGRDVIDTHSSSSRSTPWRSANPGGVASWLVK